MRRRSDEPILSDRRPPYPWLPSWLPTAIIGALAIVVVILAILVANGSAFIPIAPRSRLSN
jgi:hypothetical protein